VASRGTSGVHYWVHNNMITINGQKMGKSLGNFITLPQLFAGEHEKLTQAYTPMTVRFFILQAHYRSTLDFSNEALQAAEKGYKRLMQAWKEIAGQAGNDAPATVIPGSSTVIPGPDRVSAEVQAIIDAVWEALCDDLNTPIAIANLFDAVKLINGGKLSAGDKAALAQLFDEVVGGVLGLQDEDASASGKAEKALEGVMGLVLEARKKAREEKNWAESDRIRDTLASFGITVKDTKDGATWTLE
jgi:cysteinyl-tRNA synthetase